MAGFAVSQSQPGDTGVPSVSTCAAQQPTPFEAALSDFQPLAWPLAGIVGGLVVLVLLLRAPMWQAPSRLLAIGARALAAAFVGVNVTLLCMKPVEDRFYGHDLDLLLLVSSVAAYGALLWLERLLDRRSVPEAKA